MRVYFNKNRTTTQYVTRYKEWCERLKGKEINDDHFYRGRFHVVRVLVVSAEAVYPCDEAGRCNLLECDLFLRRDALTYASTACHSETTHLVNQKKKEKLTSKTAKISLRCCSFSSIIFLLLYVIILVSRSISLNSFTICSYLSSCQSRKSRSTF